MELMVIPKGTKYIVQDKKSRLLYTVKKKAFGGKYILLDASDYNLYTLQETVSGRKPIFTIILNDKTFMVMTCKSLFLDPTIDAEGEGMKFSITSKDRKRFKIIKNDAAIGEVRTILMLSGALQYEISIDDMAFDDYIPLFAIAIDIAFGDINKNK